MATGNKVMSGARGRVEVDGVKIGVATNCDVNLNIRQQPNVVLDELEPDGFCTTGTEVSVTIGRLLIPGNTAADMGLFPKMDADKSIRKATILDFPEMTLRLTDSKTDTKVMTVKGMVPGQLQVRFQAGAVVAENITFPATVAGLETLV